MKLNKFFSVVVFALTIFSIACTDAQFGKFRAVGGTATVRCYSGSLLIYEGISTGKVSNSESSDGYFFVDSKDNKLKEVSGNCIITYDTY